MCLLHVAGAGGSLGGGSGGGEDRKEQTRQDGDDGKYDEKLYEGVGSS
jgi:hypothetical protein